MGKKAKNKVAVTNGTTTKKKKRPAPVEPEPEDSEDSEERSYDGDLMAADEDDAFLGSDDELLDIEKQAQEEEEEEASIGEGEEEEEPGSDGAGSDAGEPTQATAAPAKSAHTDLGQLKQAITDDAGLLSAWRSSKELGTTRKREEVMDSLVSNIASYYGYSEDLARYFLQMFKAEEALELFEANEKSRPLTIRANSLKTRRSNLAQSLIARRANVDPIGDWTKVGLKVYESSVPIGATPEYLSGRYMIQSASSFIPVMALAPQLNETVCDMAAAPGGKTTYIGQLMQNTGTLFANDLRADRLKSLIANAHRMGLTNVIAVNMDGTQLSKSLPRLDRVLLDAPCSGSGIIARDPSIKVKRGMEDFESHSHLQKVLLKTAIKMVDANSKTGGYIVYSTCSMAVEENEAVVDYALKHHNVELVSFENSVNFGVDAFTRYRGHQFHPSLKLAKRYQPHTHNMDGFFVAKFKKITNKAEPSRPKKDRGKGKEHLKTWGEEHWTDDWMNEVQDFSGPQVQNRESGKRKKVRAGRKLLAAEADKAKPDKPIEKTGKKKLKKSALARASAEEPELKKRNEKLLKVGNQPVSAKAGAQPEPNRNKKKKLDKVEASGGDESQKKKRTIVAVDGDGSVKTKKKKPKLV